MGDISCKAQLIARKTNSKENNKPDRKITFHREVSKLTCLLKPLTLHREFFAVRALIQSLHVGIMGQAYTVPKQRTLNEEQDW